jgi:DNA polymerase-3 subunit beta
MELKIGREKLVSALDTVTSVVSSRPTLPILGNVLIDARKKEIIISATDLEVGVVIKVEAQSAAEGKITVPARKLLDVVKEMPAEEVSITGDAGARMQLSSGKVEIKLLGLPPDEFPQLPEVKKDAEVRIGARVFAEMIRKTIYSVSADETRYVLNGALVLWEKSELKVVTTDGRRLAFMRRPLQSAGGKGEAIVPTKALQELVRLLANREDEVTMTLGEGYARFTAGNISLTTRLIDGNFPDYEQVIPKANDKKVTLDTDVFLAGVKRSSLIAADRSSSVRIDAKKGALVLTASSPELGEAHEELPARYDGAELSVAYNARYLLDVLKHVESKEVLLELSTPLAPGVLKPVGDETYICVVMPIRL